MIDSVHILCSNEHIQKLKFYVRNFEYFVSKMMKSAHANILSRLGLVIAVAGFFAFSPSSLQKTQSANLTSVSDTLSTSKLSFYGLMGSGNSIGETLININTTTAPSTSSSQLASPSASTVKIGATVYNLSGTMPNQDQSHFSISSALLSGDQTAGNAIIATSSASHTIRFTTATAVPNGSIRVLVQATSNNGTSADGIPDGDGFDLGFTAASVACPTDSGTYDFVAGTASAAAVTINSVKYHVFECRYSGAGSVGGSFQTNPIILTSLINPAPKTTHAVGTSDGYSVLVQNLDYAYTLVDQTAIQIGVIEQVRVSATVAPQITFKIAGIPSGALGSNACGTTTDVTTTPTTVPFGQVSITSFMHAAQSLEVSTNAIGGYAVTAQQNNQLKLVGTSTTLADATGNGANITYGAKGRWDSTTYKGFGYGLKYIGKVSGTGSAAFQYTDTDANCVGGTFCAKQFADLSNAEPAQTIFSSTGIADSENVDVCYKIVISNIQAAGDYENDITYTATSTF